MNYALIGCGRISPNHITAAQNNRLNIVALCDLDEGLIKDCYPDLAGKAKLYTDYKAMLENERLDLVAIATESGNHASLAIDCIQRGIHTIIEKPIALSLSDADAIIQAAEKSNIKVCACHQNRFNKAIQSIRHALEAGRFGKLYHGTAHIRWNRNMEYYQQAPWRGTWEQDGGALMNQCIHNIDLLRWMMGDAVTEVMAYTDRLQHDYIQAEDLGLAIVKFANGTYGTIEGTTNVYPKNLEETLYLFGETGTVKAGGTSVNRLDEWMFSDGLDDAAEVKEGANEAPPNVYGFGHTMVYENMIHAIQVDQTPYIDAHAGRNALELVLAIYESASQGRPVQLPLKESSTLKFTGRFDV